MNAQKAQEILDKVMEEILGRKNPFSLDAFMEKFAFDVRLPSETDDMFNGKTTWVMSLAGPKKFISMDSRTERSDIDDWILPRRDIKSMTDIFNVWNEVNYTIGERYIDTEHVAESDAVYRCQYVYRSQDLSDSKYAVFCDSIHAGCEYVVASQRSSSCSYSARVIDTLTTSSSFNVNWSKNITKSLFIDDCYDLFECMFCSHIGSKKYCIANMQFEETEYYKIKEMVIDWLINS